MEVRQRSHLRLFLFTQTKVQIDASVWGCRSELLVVWRVEVLVEVLEVGPGPGLGPGPGPANCLQIVTIV